MPSASFTKLRERLDKLLLKLPYEDRTTWFADVQRATTVKAMKVLIKQVNKEANMRSGRGGMGDDDGADTEPDMAAGWGKLGIAPSKPKNTTRAKKMGGKKAVCADGRKTKRVSFVAKGEQVSFRACGDSSRSKKQKL